MINAHESTLENGLRIVVAPQPALHRVAVSLYVHVGSRYETPENNGISHFLEHMLYRGTERHPSAHLQNLAFERLGGTLWAATHSDHTILGTTVPPRSLGETLDLLGEVVRAPRLGEIELERRIIHEEIMEDLDEDGRQVDPDNVVRALAFGDHPLGYTITGPLEAIERFDEHACRKHLRSHWVASNALLAVAGACDPSDVIAHAKEAFSSMPRGQAPAAVPFVTNQKSTRRKHVASPGSQTDLRVSFVTPGEKHPLAPAIELLLRVLDDGMSTRLYHRLCDGGGLVYDTSASWEPYPECGALDLTAEVAHERLPPVVDALLAMIEELVAHGPTEEEVKKARDRQRWGVEGALDGAEDLVALTGGATFFGRPHELEAQASRFDRVTPSDVATAAREVFRADRMQLVTIGTLSSSVREHLRGAIKKYAAR